MADGQCDFVEHFKTPLNPCSLETLPPVSWADDKRFWPLMLGCYELDESTGKRNGRLDFYAVSIPEKGENFQGIGKPRNIIGPENPLSGVLDGKWYHRRLNDGSLLYATAHSSGEIVVHNLQDEQVNLIGRTDSRDSGLCLSLSWDVNDESGTTGRIVSSYSDGKVAIHMANISSDKIEFEQMHCWDAHKMFRSPAEVWAASLVAYNPNLVLSGGDESMLKLWDLRSGFGTPAHTLKDFSAGVTVISPHPQISHVVACGSYDETVCIYDLRAIASTKPTPLFHSNSVGGGLWRMKWHPFDNNRLLLGAMHGGCRIVQLDNLTSESVKFEIQQDFTKHESMAYGADWLVDATTQLEIAASCSFYDRAFYAWNVDVNEKSQ